MRPLTSLTLPLCLFLFLPGLSFANPLQRALHDLDSSLDLAEVYRSNFESRMSSARERLLQSDSDSLRWECAFELFTGYSLVNNDSTMMYLSSMGEYSRNYPDLQLITKVCRSEMYSLTGDRMRFDSSVPLLLEGNIPASVEPRYYSIIIDSYSNFPFHNADNDIELLDRAIDVESLPENMILYYKGLREKTYNDNQRALDYLNRAYDSTLSPYLKACIAGTIASVYHDWDERYNEELWLARSATYHVQTPALLPSSLYKLAMLLFEDKELDKASRYTRFVLSNAIDSGYTDTVINSVKAQLAIMDTLDKSRTTKMRILMVALAMLFLAAALTTYLWRRSMRDRRSLVSSQEALSLSNERLKESDKVKDGVMFNYMLQSVGYVGEIDGQRRKYNKILKEEGEEALKKALRDPSYGDAMYKDFYRTFDKTFLDIFPDFIDKVNALFPEGSRFQVSEPLNTQLRILAVIKLGLTDSGQIARFLNCSPSSVYTHRSRLKHKALCDNDEFENIIQNI